MSGCCEMYNYLLLSVVARRFVRYQIRYVNNDYDGRYVTVGYIDIGSQYDIAGNSLVAAFAIRYVQHRVEQWR